MQSQGNQEDLGVLYRAKEFGTKRWGNLTESQKKYAKKIWGVLTYKWRWQIALNIPYLSIFILDRTIPAVHKFDMGILAMVASKIPMQAQVYSWLGLS